MNKIFCSALLLSGIFASCNADTQRKPAPAPFSQPQTIELTSTRPSTHKVRTAPALLNIDADTVTRACCKKATCASTVISAPTTITQSGPYCLSRSIAGTITIAADNVTLDLNSYEINANGSDYALVIQDATNVTVFNGSITGAQEAGIFIDPSAFVTIHDISILDNVTYGIDAQNVNGLTLKNINFTRGNCAFDLIGITHGVFENISIQEHTATFDAIAVVRTSTSLLFKNISAQNNLKQLDISQFIGRASQVSLLCLSGCSNITMSDINLSNNVYESGDIDFSETFGLLFFRCDNGSISNVKVNNNELILYPWIFNDDGSFVGSGCILCADFNCTNIRIDHAQTNSNTAQASFEVPAGGATFGGFTNKNSTSCTYTDCQFNNNSTDNGALVGLLIGDPNGSNCVVNNFQCNFNSIPSTYWSFRAIAIEADSRTRGILIDNVQFNNNTIGDAQFLFVFIADVEAILSFAGINDITCLNVQCNNNVLGITQTFNGIQIPTGNAFLVDNLQFNNNLIASLENFPLGDSNISAIQLIGSLGAQCTNCASNNNIVFAGRTDNDETLRGIVSGIWIENYPNFGILTESIEIQNFQFLENALTSTQPFNYISGIFMENNPNTVIDSCYIANNFGGDTSSGIFANNFFEPAGAVNAVIQNCVISQQSGGGTFSNGITLLEASNSIIKNCEILDCQNSGIALYGRNEAISILDCIASGNEVGFEFTSSSTASCCLVQDCKAINNAVAGFVHGPVDFSTTFIGNQAQCNGDNPATQNFVAPLTSLINLQQLSLSNGAIDAINPIGSSSAALGARYTNMSIVA